MSKGEKEGLHETERLMQILEKSKGEKYDKELASTLERRGRACVSKSYVQKAKDAARNAKTTEEFLERLGKAIPMLKRKGGIVYMVYPRCYCHRIKGFSGKIPEIYCQCSIGWVKELFEQALGRPIRVTLESSVLRGDAECRLHVFL